MKFKVDSKLFRIFPEAKFGALLLTGIEIKENSEISEMLKNIVASVKENYGNKDLNLLPEVSRWHEVFNTLNAGKEILPSHEALLKRAVSKGELPGINPLVDLYNSISLKKLIPMGGHNVDQIDEIDLKISDGSDSFTTMNSTETEQIPNGEIVYAAGNKVLTRNFVWRQSDTSKITNETKNVFVPIDDASGKISRIRLHKIAQEVAALVKNYFGGSAKFGVVDKFNFILDFETLPELDVPEEILKLLKAKPVVNSDEAAIDEVLGRGVRDILPGREELKKILMSGKRIKIYQGFDPSADKLHIGNAIGMKMLEKFRALGHHVVFLMGTGTGKIGDPTDKLATRKVLTDVEIEKNIANWKSQASQILDFDNAENPVEIVRNGDWLAHLDLDDFLNIGNRVTIQQLLERDMFQNRIKENKPISVSEVLYPLLQGYDSVEMEVDAEFGGSDQMFNMMMGRTLLKSFKDKEKWVITGKILEDDGGNKMGKSTGNVINLIDPATTIFRNVMKFTDGMIIPGFEILTDVDMKEVKNIEMKIKAGENPIEFKKKLAFEVTKWLKGETESFEAEKEFEQTKRKNTPENRDKFILSPAEYNKIIKSETPAYTATQVVTIGGLYSNSDLKRLITSGASLWNGEKMSDLNYYKIKNDLEEGKSGTLRIDRDKWIDIFPPTVSIP